MTSTIKLRPAAPGRPDGHCPHCAGALVASDDGDLVCINCARHLPIEQEHDLEEIGEALDVEFDLHAHQAWPTGRKRGALYDQLIPILLRYHQRGEGIRFKLNPQNKSSLGESVLRAALRRAGADHLGVSSVDRGGYRYIRLIRRKERRPSDRSKK